MEKKLALIVNDVSLNYEFVQSKSIKREIVSKFKFWKKENKTKSIQALKNISFEINKGDSVGIIGRNGAGKSTLLRVIAGIFKPESGQINIENQKVSLLALGTGFQQELSGVENIYLNGLLLGLSRKEIKSRMKDIIEFSQLGEFINYPVRTYSSGMRSRLAFSTASHVDPDILLIDEVIGVGDEEFKRKSSERIMNLISSERTVVIVSHNLAYVKEMCDKTVWLEKGEMVMFGDTEKVVEAYISETRKK